MTARKPARRGVALLLVLIAMGTATTLALGWLASHDNAVPLSRNVSRTLQARAAAYSGLELAVAVMQTPSDWRTAHDNGMLFQDYPLANGIVDVHLIDVATELPPAAGADTIRITVTGRSDDVTQEIQAIASVINQSPPDSHDMSGFAIWVGAGLKMQGHSTMNRWEAAPMAGLGRRLFIGTTATTTRSIEIGSNALLPDTTLIHDEDSSYGLVMNDSKLPIRQQTISTNFGPPESPASLPPLTGNNESNSGFNPRLDNWDNHPHDLEFDSGATIELPADSSMSLETLTLENGTSLIISGDTTLTIHDDFTINEGAIMLAPGATLNLALGGNVQLNHAYLGDESGQELGNSTGPSWFDTSHLHITSSGENPDNRPWRLRGSTIVKAIIEAPQQTMVMRDEAMVAGRIAVDHLRLRHQASIHYDHGLDSGKGPAQRTEEPPLTIRERIARRMNQRLLDLLNHFGNRFNRAQETAASEQGSSASFGISADAAWSSDPSNRNVQIELQLMMHGGDTRKWESLVAAGKSGSVW